MQLDKIKDARETLEICDLQYIAGSVGAVEACHSESNHAPSAGLTINFNFFFPFFMP